MPDFGDAANNLRDVRVSRNNIRSLNASNFLQFVAVTSLHLTNNPFDCFPSLSNTPVADTLQQLRVNELQLDDSCPPEPLANLTSLVYLEAVNSGLNVVPRLGESKAVIVGIQLRGNPITVITENDLSDTPNLNTL